MSILLLKITHIRFISAIFGLQFSLNIAFRIRILKKMLIEQFPRLIMNVELLHSPRAKFTILWQKMTLKQFRTVFKQMCWHCATYVMPFKW